MLISSKRSLAHYSNKKGVLENRRKRTLFGYENAVEQFKAWLK